MLTMIARRLAQLPLILLVTYTLTLALAWGVPGDPLQSPDARQAKPEVLAAMRAQYNLDSFWSFYFSYLADASGFTYVRATLDGSAARQADAARAAGVAPPPRRVFDLGPSLQYRDQRVNDVIAAALPVSVTIGAAAMLIALALGLAAGILGAVRPNSLLDLSTLTLALVGISLPSFVVGTLLLQVFGLWLGLGSVGSWGELQDLFLPSLTLSLPFAAYIARLTRMGMLDVLGADFIRTARAKGAGETRVLLRHALKNAFLPVLSYLGPATALAMTGSFVVERVFTVPGLGQHFVNAVQTKDLVMLMGVVLVFSTLLILFNLAVDILYRWVDPRIE